jgi:hypothetical protein
MTTALDAALAQLDAALDTSEPSTGSEVVTDGEVVAGSEPVTEVELALTLTVEEKGPSSIDDELAQLEAMIGSEIPTLETSDDALIDIPTLEEVASEIAAAESREEAYSKMGEPEDSGTPDATIEPDPDAGEKLKKGTPKIKARAHGEAKPSAALVARLGSVEAVTAHLKISEGDDAVDAKELVTALSERLSGLDDLPKKVGEKAVNLIAHLGGGAKLSCYTEIAIKMLVSKGELTSKELIDRYIARPYSEGTSRSQCGQMMQLLPALGLADRTTRGSLTLRKDSVIAKQLSDAFSAAA